MANRRVAGSWARGEASPALGNVLAGETCPVLATFERKVRPRSDPRKEGEAMARSEILQKIEDLSEERERLLAREGSHHAGAGDHRRLAEIDHSLGVLWDLRRRELAGEDVGLDEDLLDRYVINPGDDAPDDYTWAR